MNTYGSALPATCSSLESDSSSLSSSSLDLSSGAVPMSSGFAYFSQYSEWRQDKQHEVILAQGYDIRNAKDKQYIEMIFSLDKKFNVHNGVHDSVFWNHLEKKLTK